MKILSTLIRDLFGLAGVGSVTYGCYLINLPMACIVGGSLCIAIAVLTALGER